MKARARTGGPASSEATLVVGTLRLTLQIAGSASLKSKRQVVRKIVDRIRARFNVSIAEVADNDLWQRATLGVAAVGNERAFVNEVLDKVLDAVEGSGADAVILSHDLEIVTLGHHFGARPERTLAEAEGLFSGDDEGDDDDYPSLEELEAADERPPGSKGRR